MNDQELESNKDLKLSHDMSASFKDGKELNNEKEVEFKDCAAQCLAIEKHTNSEDLDSLNTNGVKRRNGGFLYSYTVQRSYMSKFLPCDYHLPPNCVKFVFDCSLYSIW